MVLQRWNGTAAAAAAEAAAVDCVYSRARAGSE
jgi:hypothetical protein